MKSKIDFHKYARQAAKELEFEDEIALYFTRLDHEL